MQTSPREGRHSGSRRSKTRRPQRSSSGEGLAAYADGLRASGSESYHEAMARSSGKARGGMSLEDIASAASPYDFESPGAWTWDCAESPGATCHYVTRSLSKQP